MRKSLFALAVFAAAVGVYLNSLPGAFISDDRPIVLENPLVRKPISISEILASSYWPKSNQLQNAQARGGLYRPLTILSFALNRRIIGSGPFGFHLVNVILHGVVSVLLFFVMNLLGCSLEASVVGALAFAVLPVHTEAVSWIVGRAEILGAVFLLAAWLLLHNSNHWAKTVAGLGCYALALLSKESAAPLPVALVLGELFQRRGTVKSLVERRLTIWVSAFGVLVMYLAWRRAVLGSAFSVGAPYFRTQSPLVVCLTMARFFLRGWMGPMITGLGLCADYSRPSFQNAATNDPGAWMILLSIIFILVWAIHDFRARRAAWAFSALVFICFAAPLSNLLVPMEIIGAERIMYIPSIGICLLISSVWDSLRRRPSFGSWPKVLVLGCLLWWSAWTIARNRIWRSEADFFAAAAECAPASPRSLSGLGTATDQAGRHVEARGLYRKALENDPDFTQAAYNMGKSYYEEGDLRNAKFWFQYLEKRSRADKDTLCFLGLISEHDGHYREALAYYARALERDPAALDPRLDAGLLLYRTGRVGEAVKQLQEYLRNGPPAEDAHNIETFLEQIKTQK